MPERSTYLHKRVVRNLGLELIPTDNKDILWIGTKYSFRTNSLARSPGQEKLDSDKWKLWKNLFEYIEIF